MSHTVSHIVMLTHLLRACSCYLLKVLSRVCVTQCSKLCQCVTCCCRHVILRHVISLSLQLGYLRHVLVCLSGVPELWQVHSVQRMWRSVLLTPLTSAVPPLSEQQVQECYQTLCLLHRSDNFQLFVVLLLAPCNTTFRTQVREFSPSQHTSFVNRVNTRYQMQKRKFTSDIELQRSEIITALNLTQHFEY